MLPAERVVEPGIVRLDCLPMYRTGIGRFAAATVDLIHADGTTPRKHLVGSYLFEASSKAIKFAHADLEGPNVSQEAIKLLSLLRWTMLVFVTGQVTILSGA